MCRCCVVVQGACSPAPRLPPGATQIALVISGRLIYPESPPACCLPTLLFVVLPDCPNNNKAGGKGALLCVCHTLQGRMSWATPADDNPFAVSASLDRCFHSLCVNFPPRCKPSRQSSSSSIPPIDPSHRTVYPTAVARSTSFIQPPPLLRTRKVFLVVAYLCQRHVYGN